MNTKMMLGMGAVVVALAATGCSGAAKADTPKPTPTTVTVTETPEVETETVTEVPQACLDALDEAEQIRQSYIQFSKLAAGYPGMILRAAQAGVSMDATALNSVTADVKASTAKVNALSDRVGPHVSRYQSKSLQCRLEAS